MFIFVFEFFLIQGDLFSHLQFNTVVPVLNSMRLISFFSNFGAVMFGIEGSL